MRLRWIALITGTLLVSVVAPAAPGAGDFELRLLALQQRWALADFELQGEAQGRLLDKLLGEARLLHKQYPGAPNPW